MERTESHMSDASSIVGGEPVDEDIKRRIYGFNLPFSGDVPRRVTIPASLPFFGSSKPEPSDPLLWNDPHDIAKEDRECRENYKNPRTYALKTQFEPQRPTLNPPQPIPDINGTVVIMGGYRGSTLRDTKTNRQVWAPFKVGLNIRKVDLELGLDDEAEWNAAEKIYSDSMLTHIGPIDISRKLIRRLKHQKNCRVLDWGYDWRLSCTNSARKLVEYLKKLHIHDERGAIIIAHSMGGLIAHYALQQLLENSPHQKLIRGIVYVGCPSDCVPVLGPLRLSDPVMLAKDILSPKVNFTMRSSFVFLPDDGKCFVDAEDPAKEYDIDLWDVKNWVKYNLSPCVAEDPEVRKTQVGSLVTSAQLPQDAAIEYLERTLDRTRDFRRGLSPIDDREYPPMAVIYGNTLPTVVGAKVDREDDISTTQFDNPLYGSGDGVVFRKSLLPLKNGFDPDKYHIKVIATKDGHIGLISNTQAIGDALTHILQREGAQITYSPLKKKRFATTRAKVHGINPFQKAKSLFKRNSVEYPTGGNIACVSSSNFMSEVSSLESEISSPPDTPGMTSDDQHTTLKDGIGSESISNIGNLHINESVAKPISEPVKEAAK